MMLYVQIAKFKFRQYQMRAVSPNLILAKVTHYVVCLMLLLIMLCHIPVPIRAQGPSTPPTSPTWRSTITVDMTFWTQSMRQPSWKTYRKIHKHIHCTCTCNDLCVCVCVCVCVNFAGRFR